MAPRNVRYLRPLSVAADEVDRAIRYAILELRAHGGSENDAAHLIREFKRLTEEETQRSETKLIPD
jgi:hypothetical protein